MKKIIQVISVMVLWYMFMVGMLNLKDGTINAPDWTIYICLAGMGLWYAASLTWYFSKFFYFSQNETRKVGNNEAKEKGCITCRHLELPMGSEPCYSCRGHSEWV